MWLQITTKQEESEIKSVKYLTTVCEYGTNKIIENSPFSSSFSDVSRKLNGLKFNFVAFYYKDYFSMDQCFGSLNQKRIADLKSHVRLPLA